MFVGTFEHSLDDKGRLVLPTAFRGRLADGGFLGLYESCLALWTPDDFEAFVDRLNERVREREVDPNAMRVLTAHASEVRPDGQGRINIPAPLRTYADLEGEAILIGAQNHIEIWNRDRWSTVSGDGTESLSEAVSKLGIF